MPHTGPSWGPFLAGGDVDVLTGEVFASVEIDAAALPLDGAAGPAALRELAQHASAAAAWLDAVHGSSRC